jgi:hypothetical protein
VIVADPVEFLGGDAGFHVRRDDLQHFGGQAAGLAHLVEVGAGHNPAAFPATTGVPSNLASRIHTCRQPLRRGAPQGVRTQ